GKAISAESGHILPMECCPRITYKVEGDGDMVSVSDCYRPESYTLRCKFVFGVAKPVTVRVTTSGILAKSSLWFAIDEFLIRSQREKNVSQA
ncbi:MAG: hypothetical protein ACT4O2_12240, partial [Beijerinckiaceae bacterium]